jgi:hypothetical protein
MHRLGGGLTNADLVTRGAQPSPVRRSRRDQGEAVPRQRKWLRGPQSLAGCLRSRDANLVSEEGVAAELRDLVAGAVLQGKLYVAGGFGDGVGAVGTLEEYDPVTDDWVRRRSMPTPRFRAAAGARLMVIGGVDRTGQISEIVEAYVP